MAVEDFSQPVLAGEGASDYERYLRTDELLSLQKRPEERVHRDELLFQTVHQSSELWIKLACSEVAEATVRVRAGEASSAARLLRRAAISLGYILDQLRMLEQLSPWEYQTIRQVLGHGSGFDSPGMREIRRVSPPLWDAFVELLTAAGLDPVEVYREGSEDQIALAEGLVDWDEGVTVWRIRHYKRVARIIGDSVVGTQGTPVEVLGRLVHKQMYPDLWEARNRLTALAKEEEG
ncbi:MAG: tryptophan 2,3-dioxygenase family protein [Gaiellaceae bacterium]